MKGNLHWSREWQDALARMSRSGWDIREHRRVIVNDRLRGHCGN